MEFIPVKFLWDNRLHTMRDSNFVIISLCFSLLLVTSSVTARNNDKIAQKLLKRFTDSLNARDWDAVSDLYTDDATHATATQPYIIGREAILAYYRKKAKQGSDIELSLDFFEGSNKFVIAGGVGRILKDGQQVAVNRFMNVYKKTDGNWKIWRSMITAVPGLELVRPGI
ncbi:unnamed protein product [Owenia fusiformis]|uniref:SnoaL-like domain-containing protein n=1 Tax=Owenia fusiformis TaxID=6347 RepID=A0A8S4PAH6_OWEFU|nr:unnamed protein product [Owenia fusiformis]